MAEFIRYSIISAFLVIVLNVSSQEPDPDFTEKTALSESRKMLKLASFKESSGYAETDLIYQRMEWNVDPAIKYLKGKITSYFKVKSAGVDRISFDLLDNLTIDSVVQNKTRLSLTHSGDVVAITLKKSI